MIFTTERINDLSDSIIETGKAKGIDSLRLREAIEWVIIFNPKDKETQFLRLMQIKEKLENKIIVN